MGLTVDTASSANEAVAKVMGSPGRFDAVFMDLDMPEVSGFEAAQKILALPMDAVPRIIALSAHSSDSDRQRASEAGMSGFIVKPFVREDIIDAVQDWLPMSPKKDITESLKTRLNRHYWTLRLTKKSRSQMTSRHSKWGRLSR